MRRSDSRNPQFSQRIPQDLRSRLVGMTLEVPVGEEFASITITERTQAIRFSLRTADPAEVRLRQAAALAHLEAVYAGLRSNAPANLTHRQCVAFAGEVYRAWAADLEAFHTITVEAMEGKMVVVEHTAPEADFPMLAEGARIAAGKMLRMDGAELERQIGPLVDRMLVRRGIAAVDDLTRGMLLMEFQTAVTEGLQVQSRKAGGDYRPDPVAQRFPAWTEPSLPPSRPQPQTRSAGVTLSSLFEGWWTEAKAAGRKQSTYDSYRRTLAALGSFLKHDDATRITPENVIAFKDHRIGKGIHPKTVKDSDLAGLKAVFGWAVVNRKLPSNPAQGITLKLGPRRRLRSPGFTDVEAQSILAAAAAHRQSGAESWQMAAAKRWVPWLCAFTGARLGEIVQLRKEDVRQEDGAWVIHITPEAGTVKTDEVRDVPLHAQLVEMGFPAFVQAAPAGHLFMILSGDGEAAWRAGWRTAKNRVTEFVRGALGEANVQPSHGWRHRFATLATDLGFSGRVEDAILGHKPERVADTYGKVSLKAKHDAIGKLPRIEVAGEAFRKGDLHWSDKLTRTRSRS